MFPFEIILEMHAVLRIRSQEVLYNITVVQYQNTVKIQDILLWESSRPFIAIFTSHPYLPRPPKPLATTNLLSIHLILLF